MRTVYGPTQRRDWDDRCLMGFNIQRNSNSGILYENSVLIKLSNPRPSQSGQGFVLENCGYSYPSALLKYVRVSIKGESFGVKAFLQISVTNFPSTFDGSRNSVAFIGVWCHVCLCYASYPPTSFSLWTVHPFWVWLVCLHAATLKWSNLSQSTVKHF